MPMMPDSDRSAFGQVLSEIMECHSAVRAAEQNLRAEGVTVFEKAAVAIHKLSGMAAVGVLEKFIHQHRQLDDASSSACA